MCSLKFVYVKSKSETSNHADDIFYLYIKSEADNKVLITRSMCISKIRERTPGGWILNCEFQHNKFLVFNYYHLHIWHISFTKYQGVMK